MVDQAGPCWAPVVVAAPQGHLQGVQDQLGALVGGEAASEADGESVRGEELAEVLEGFAGFVATFGLLNSTPHSASELPPEAAAELLCTMARAALSAAAA